MSTGHPLATAVVLLAGEDTGKAGPLGLLVLVVLGLACYWLFRSMSKHLRKVPSTFAPDTARAPGPHPAASTVQPPPATDPSDTG